MLFRSFTATKDKDTCSQTSLLMKQACCLEIMGKLNDFSRYSYVYMYQSGP